MTSHAPDPAGRATTRVAAFFDMDGTVLDANIVHYFVYFATRGFSPPRRLAWLAAALPRFAYYLVLDRVSRSRFNRVFYRGYRRFAPGDIRRWSADLFAHEMEPRIFPEARRRIDEHRARSEPCILVTGSLDFIAAPLASELECDDALSVSLAERDGRFTGELTGPPLGDEEKARAVRDYAARKGIDLSRSHAYADSAADLPFLSVVGHPVAVNPDGRLRRVARERGWPCVEWASPGGGDG